MKQNIIDINDKKLVDFLKEINEPTYRINQIKNGIYVQGYNSFKNFSNLPKLLRDKLAEHYVIGSLKKVDEIISKVDGTKKFLWQLSDGYKIESVVIYENKRITFCISSQVGCPLDCKFCATGKMGILRNLTPGEIVEQVLQMTFEIVQRPSNIVDTGMGEPMLNYEAVIESANIISDGSGFGLSPKRITISTSGILPGITKMTEEKQPFNLAISLNSVEEEIRKKIMPISKKYPITKLLKAAKEYTVEMNRIITFEYVLIDKVNASIEDAKKLVKLTHQIPCKINVIPCNSSDPEYLPPPKEKVIEFENYVNTHSRRITIRKRRGWEIQAACGQLYTANMKKGSGSKKINPMEA